VTLRALALGMLVALFATGCIKVPESVRLSFCAEPAPKNHFGSGADASSCCPGPPHMLRFGSYTGPCRR
jgi:hypothetical protein